MFAERYPISEETKKLLEQWASKRGLPVDEVIERYHAQYALAMSRTPGKSPDWYERVARARLYVHLKAPRLRAKPWDGIFLGFGPAFDVTARQRAQALEILRTDPERAHAEGWVNEAGEPVDMRKTLPSGARNPFYGRPLVETFVRQSVGIARPAEGGDLKLTILQHFRDQAKKPPPLGKTVRFLANIRADEPNRYLLNTSVRTTYEPITMREFPELNAQKICDLLMTAPNDFRCNLSDLRSWHEKHQDDIRRVVIVEGIVTGVRPEPIPTTGNYMMFIEDESIMDIEAEGVTVWVHSELADQMTFGSGSRVIVIGRSVVGPGWDMEKRQIDRSVERVMINAMGVWPEPEFLIPKEEERVIYGEEVRG